MTDTTHPANLFPYLDIVAHRHITRLVIPDASGSCVLLMPDGDGWCLPEITEAKGLGGVWTRVEELVPLLRDRLGLDARPLRCLSARRHEAVYATEPPPVTWPLPDGGRWMDRDQVRAVRAEQQRRLLERWFAEQGDPATVGHQPPWYRPEWFDGAVSWAEHQLAHYDIEQLSGAEHHRLRELSSELLFQTSAGVARFKAVPDVFAHEVPLMQYLHRHFPGDVPQVLALNPSKHWMLIVDDNLDGLGLQGVPDGDLWCDAIQRYAEIQIASIEHVDALRDMGVPVRAIGEVPAKLDALFSDDQTLTNLRARDGFPDEWGKLDGAPTATPLTGRELARLRAHLPAVRTACAELAAAPAIPATLRHTNIWPEYITPTCDGFVFADWQDAAIGHPFLDVLPFMIVAEVKLPSIVKLSGIDTFARIRDAYLEPWTAFAEWPDLVRLFDMAMRVSCME